MNPDRACTLCGLDVGERLFVLQARQGTLEFCCEGCLGIYRMLHEGEAAVGGENPTQPKEK